MAMFLTTEPGIIALAHSLIAGSTANAAAFPCTAR
jgi:hypothetical protein